jgi:dihydroorotate dehydrogenase (NAD+) catalytic subunit
MTDRLTTRVGGLAFANPVLTASGTFGSGKEYAPFMDVGILGGVVTKSVTLAPTRGNPPPRVVETPSGMLNAIGLQNEGVEHFLHELLPPLRASARRVIVNLAGKTEEDYAAAAERLAGAGVDAIELNISCPNVKEGGIAFGVRPEPAARITRAVRRAAGATPLWVKLSPNVTDIVEIARAAAEAGADALVVANTFLAMAVDIDRRRPMLANVTGGLSGPCVHPLTLRLVWQVARALAEQGATLVLSARNVERLERASARAREAGARAEVLPLDLARPEDFPAARAKVAALAGVPDLLFLNAGLGQRGLALETPAAVTRALFEVDFFGTIELARQVAPDMVARGSGRIAATTSVLGKFGAPRRSTYCAAKHALHGWVDALRLELEGTGVGVTLLAPGWIRTEIGLHALTPAGRPHGRLDHEAGGGLSAGECARRMIQAIRRDRDEQLIGGLECGGVYLKRFFPGLLRRALRRVKMT